MGIRERLLAPRNRYARRLVFVLVWLAVFDQAVPPILRALEHRRYESRKAFRFENSDLFGLGPLVAYLREHPRGDRPSVVFLGNSMMFGFGIGSSGAVPAQYEKQLPGVRTLNMGVNGHELGSHYLIAKAIIDSVETMYVQVIGEGANPILGSLIPVTPADARAYGLEVPDPTERRLQSMAGRFWHLYGVNDRLQAAIFGTSTRLYLYLHKKDFALALLRPVYRRPSQETMLAALDAHLTLLLPRMAGPARRADLEGVVSTPMLALADLASSRRKRVVFLRFEYEGRAEPGASDESFNAVYAPYGEVVVVRVPLALTTDGQHLTHQGSRQLAAALIQLERDHKAAAR